MIKRIYNVFVRLFEIVQVLFSFCLILFLLVFETLLGIVLYIPVYVLFNVKIIKDWDSPMVEVSYFKKQHKWAFNKIEELT